MTEPPVLSPYYDSADIQERVAAGEHREVVGGAWDEIGRLQIELLRAHGLEPHHRVLDVGCGSLRGGVHLVRFLDPGHYFGTDLNQSLLDAGYDVELRGEGLTHRLPRENLVCDGSFDFTRLPGAFDFALAQSLFTHLPGELVRRCLERLPAALRPGASLFATCFEIPEEHPEGEPFTHPPLGIVSERASDPYHYRASDFERLCRDLPWRVEPRGAWGHPRGQNLVRFERLADAAS